jgi:hypothetical protein
VASSAVLGCLALAIGVISTCARRYVVARGTVASIAAIVSYRIGGAPLISGRMLHRLGPARPDPRGTPVWSTFWALIANQCLSGLAIASFCASR